MSLRGDARRSRSEQPYSRQTHHQYRQVLPPAVRLGEVPAVAPVHPEGAQYHPDERGGHRCWGVYGQQIDELIGRRMTLTEAGSVADLLRRLGGRPDDGRSRET